MAKKELNDLWDKEKSNEKPPYPKDGQELTLDLFSLKRLTEVRGYRLTDVEGEMYCFSQSVITQIADARKPEDQLVKVKYIARDFGVKGSFSTVIILK